MKRSISFAVVYDFDGTLAPGNMQERNFIPAINTDSKAFWKEVRNECEAHKADDILMYMMLMLRKANAAQVKVRKGAFETFGKDLPFFQGIIEDDSAGTSKHGWFDRISMYGKKSGVSVEHYIVSSGIREMIEGTLIRKKFKAIFASSFYYDHNGVATWPALALNYTTKTQYLFRINKGSLSVHDHKEINKYTPDCERAIPFSRMIYIGDGETDVPCFRLVKDRGGASIAVYKPNTKGAKDKSLTLSKEGRVSFVCPADYRDGRELDRVVKALIDKAAIDCDVDGLKPHAGRTHSTRLTKVVASSADGERHHIEPHATDRSVTSQPATTSSPGSDSGAASNAGV